MTGGRAEGDIYRHPRMIGVAKRTELHYRVEVRKRSSRDACTSGLQGKGVGKYTTWLGDYVIKKFKDASEVSDIKVIKPRNMMGTETAEQIYLKRSVYMTYISICILSL